MPLHGSMPVMAERSTWPMHGFAVPAWSRAWHLQRLGPAAQRGVVRDGQSEPLQVDDRTDQPLGLPQRQMEHGPERRRCPPWVVRGSAVQAATASSVNHTVRLPR